MTENKNINENGFAMILALVLLLVMTLMGTILVVNASNQTEVTTVSETGNQTFLTAETGVESASRWIYSEVAKNNFPKNGNSTISTLCGYNLGGNIKFVKNYSNVVSNEMDIKNQNEKRIYDKQKFYYVISEFGQSTVSNVGAGGTVSSSTNYGTAGGQMSYFYKIYSCAIGGDNNQKSMLEVVISVAS